MEIKNRNEIEEQYKWDLSTLYKDDEAWQKDIDSLDELINKCSTYQGKLNNAKDILAYFEVSTELERKVANTVNYAFLKQSEDTRESKPNRMMAISQRKAVEAGTATAYAPVEILGLDDSLLESIVNDESLKDYKFILEQIIREKKHTLSLKEEELLAQLQEPLSSFSEISDKLMDADMHFEDIEDSEGNKHELSNANYILYQMSPDRTLRHNAFKSYYKEYKQYIHTLAATYAGTLKTATTEARLRNYASSREMSLFGNNIPVSVYDQLIETVRKHMGDMYRYVKLRKEILGVDELHYYDLYTPLVGDVEEKYTYDEAQEIILEALKPLGEKYVNTVREGFKSRWIDVYPNTGKSSGAYSSGTYDSNPFILTNFNGTLDNVSTIIHELGHSMHTWLANHNQPPQYADYTLFVAEVASTVNENLLIEQLLKKETDPKKKLSLLNHYLESFKGTVYRQTMFAEFEKKAHELVESGGAAEEESLSEIYEQLIKDYFGEELVIDEEVRYEWSRIPHFYNPFYVYVYATGYSSAVSISEKILSGEEGAKDNYLSFLSMGGSRYPLEELKVGGVDLMTPDPIDRALDKFARVLDEAEEIVKSMK